MARPRVLMLGWEFPPLINGGLGVACEGLALALAGKTELNLILPKSGATASAPPIHSAFSLSEVPLDLNAYLDARNSPSPSQTLYEGDLRQKILSFASEALKMAQTSSFDLIHAHDWMTGLAALEIRKQSGKPLLFHVHSLSHDRVGPDESGWIHQLEQRIIQEADLTIAVSNYTRQICLNHYHANPAKTSVVHNGISPVEAYRSTKPFSESLVVFLGRMTSQKGPIRFLQIAREVLRHNPKVRFVIAGTGDLLHRSMAESVRLGLAEHCHFTGFLNRQEVHQLFSMADVYCMPSTSEPFGLSALEAAQFGVPTVISNRSGVAEILNSAKTADASDTKKMAHEILAQIEAGVTKPPVDLRSWDQAADEILQHYKKLTE